MNTTLRIMLTPTIQLQTNQPTNHQTKPKNPRPAQQQVVKTPKPQVWPGNPIACGLFSTTPTPNPAPGTQKPQGPSRHEESVSSIFSTKSNPPSPPEARHNTRLKQTTRKPTNTKPTHKNAHQPDRWKKLLLRKEVIQPHLPVRLPCYDFVPIASPTFDHSPQTVRPWASGVTNFRDVTGGVYKARERIHRSVADLRLLATPTSWGRVADPNPN